MNLPGLKLAAMAAMLWLLQDPNAEIDIKNRYKTKLREPASVNIWS